MQPPPPHIPIKIKDYFTPIFLISFLPQKATQTVDLVGGFFYPLPKKYIYSCLGRIRIRVTPPAGSATLLPTATVRLCCRILIQTLLSIISANAIHSAQYTDIKVGF